MEVINVQTRSLIRRINARSTVSSSRSFHRIYGFMTGITAIALAEMDHRLLNSL
ncbi:uncharacterized protein BO96DRAFT_408467 [Aspergillus niger CBS 101883]|uniref:uncharacterized protein n=1 Tax=Aspergillus lacticoffeatus (strain CBS 101883) TaxID=1450533 RepID=UPI000D8027AC|nr:uncharacterized protein BO96DRAFT_408467 [Aspergillus niger CBS 101883]PYH61672.1 hypothetical protein BO96DRAFT_408467 [Aspergillus niger CBS 101883]